MQQESARTDMRKHPCQMEDHQLQPRADCPYCTKGLERKPYTSYVGGPAPLYETTPLTDSAANVANGSSDVLLNNVVRIPIPSASSQTLDYVAGQFKLDELSKLSAKIGETQAEIITMGADLEYLKSRREYLVGDLRSKERAYVNYLQELVERERQEIDELERLEKEVRYKKKEREENMNKLQKQHKKEKKESKMHSKPAVAEIDEVDKTVRQLQVRCRIDLSSKLLWESLGLHIGSALSDPLYPLLFHDCLKSSTDFISL